MVVVVVGVGVVGDVTGTVLTTSTYSVDARGFRWRLDA